MTNSSKPQTVLHLFEQQALRNPQAVAVLFEDTQLSYAALNQQANQLAHALRRRGVKPETRVGLYLERSPQMIVAILGVLKAGGAYVPIDPTYPKERLDWLFADAQLSFLVTQLHLQWPQADRDSSQHPMQDMHWFCLDDSRWGLTQESTDDPQELPLPHHLAYVIYTSGSTGKPKGVMIEHQALFDFVQTATQRYGIQANVTSGCPHRLLQFAAISFDAAVEEIFITLTQGATLVLRTPEMVQTIPQFLQACAQLQITVLDLPTAFWHQLCAELPQLHLPSTIQTVIIGGERAIPHWVNVWRQHVSPEVRLINTYGPTETTVVATCCDLAGPHAIPLGDRLVPIGQPLPHLRAYVLDAAGQPVPPEARGELYLAGSGLARGYLNQPTLTRQVFVDSLGPDGSPLRLYKTGDWVRQRSDGHLEFIGRVDHQEKIRGFRVDLHDIEVQLEAHPSVQAAVVMAREDRPGQRQLVAYVTAHRDAWLSHAPSWEAEQLDQWQRIHDDEGLNPANPDWEHTFNISGWVSSYTGELIPDAEMQAWVDATVTQILALRPHRVLELGCGTGLMLFRVAPHCQTYVGTDFSATALNYIYQQLPALNLPQVILHRHAADQLQRYTPASFDTLILNSVIQYFPSVDYLLRVLTQAMPLIQPGGTIFIGDVRHYGLLEAFALWVELSQAPVDLPTDILQERVRQRLCQEEELTLTPAFFMALPRYFPQIGAVQILMKRGETDNELTQFRYDVVLHVETAPSLSPPPQCLDWATGSLTLPQVQAILRQECPSALVLKRVPNARVMGAIAALQTLHAPNCPTTVGPLLAQPTQGIHPEALATLAQDCGYGLTLSWAEGAADGAYTAILYQAPAEVSAAYAAWIEALVLPPESAQPPQPGSHHANNPLHSKMVHHLSVQLRQHLQRHLPAYQVPAAIVVLEHFPLTDNGKVNRRNLPLPSSQRPPIDTPLVYPATPLEKELANLWSKVLGVHDLGIHDNFFDLGGDSLRLMQLLGQIEARYPQVIAFNQFFAQPTIAGLCQQIQTPGPINPGAPSEFMSLSQLQAEAQRQSLAIQDQGTAPQPTAKHHHRWVHPQRILLTGATGFIGLFLLQELLQQTAADIYCLVRAGTPSAARQKLQRRWHQLLPYHLLPSHRVIPVPGDLSQPQLGLSLSQFDQLAHDIDVIYHGGAEVNLRYPYRALKDTNALGTRSIVTLAMTHRPKLVHYLSTLDVYESAVATGAKIIYEHDDIAQGPGISGGYAQSKWVAESLVTTAARQGLSVCIYRPGMVTGHSQTGAANPDDLLSRFLLSLIQTQSAPQIPLSVDMTPVDYLCSAIVALSCQPQSWGKAFHLINPQPMTLAELVVCLNQWGFGIRPLAYDAWQARLSTPGNALEPLAPVLTEVLGQQRQTRLEMWLSGTQIFDSRNTQAGLQGSSITFPAVAAPYLKQYLSQVPQWVRGAANLPLCDPAP